MKIVAFDQATRVSGFSVFNNGKLIEFGEINSDPKEKNAITRIEQQYRQISVLLKRQKPTAVCLEDTIYERNLAGFGTLCRLQGCIISLLFEMKLPFQIVGVTTWRKYCEIIGKNKAEKKADAQRYVREKFGVEVSEDTAEAICIGDWASNNIKMKGKSK